MVWNLEKGQATDSVWRHIVRKGDFAKGNSRKGDFCSNEALQGWRF